MAVQTVFQRYELKYMLTKEQKARILEAMTPYMELDEFGRKTVRNIYYDTDTYRLIRHSIESPVYKEKLRVRSYEQATGDSTVFVELKKKYRSVVYKRRLTLTEAEAMAWIGGEAPCRKDTQISREIDYFLGCYGKLHPAVFLTYEREAYFTKEPSDFRVTFDDTILCRQEAISLKAPIGGSLVIPEDQVLMEIKCSGGIPLWMVSVLSEQRIRKTSFSKYGTAYQSMIVPEIINKHKEVVYDGSFIQRRI